MKESKLNTALKEELFLLNKEMSRAERLNAFFAHSRLLMGLFETGVRYRKRNAARRIVVNSAKGKFK